MTARYGCSSASRRVLFCFGYTSGWWDTLLEGFTHVGMVEVLAPGLAVTLEPVLSHCAVAFGPVLESRLRRLTVVEVCVTPTKRNRLIRPILQTCATQVQYLAGLSLGCITAQGLYEALTNLDERTKERNGIHEVTLWEQDWKPHC
jgi:hypothetical protein